jgi:1,3-beta-glucan synthase
MHWSATALSGVATSTTAEFQFTRRVLFLLVTLALTVGPTLYIATAGDTRSLLPLILGIVQLFISIVSTLLFDILSSGGMFSNRVTGKSHKYLASQTFTANSRVPPFTMIPRTRMQVYRKLLLPHAQFLRPHRRDGHHGRSGCNDKFFGIALCSHQSSFTLAIMYLMDIVLFFREIFMWYIIWNMVFSIAGGFKLGLDAMEGYLHEVAEADLCEAVGYW